MNENLEQGKSLWFCFNYAMLPLHKITTTTFLFTHKYFKPKFTSATKYASSSKGLYAKAIIIVFRIYVQIVPKRSK